MAKVLLLITLLLGVALPAPVHATASAPMGWLIIPAIGLYAPIHPAAIVDGYHQIGAAINHLEGTTFVGDGWGRVVLAAHNPGWFGRLGELEKGDRILVYTDTGVYEFQVSTMTIVSDDVRILHPTAAYTLTLLTCWDRGVTWLAVDAQESD